MDSVFIRIAIVHYGSLEKNQKVALASITFWFASKERPLHFTSKTILFNRVKVATSSKELAMNF